MTAYIHYLLVNSRSISMRGIGKKLVEKVKNTYKDYLRIVLVAYNDEIGFYDPAVLKRRLTQAPCL